MSHEDTRPLRSAVQPVSSGASMRLLQRYEALAQVSRRMLEAAREDDWMQVARLETRCGELIDDLRAAMRLETLSAEEQRQRIAYLRHMLADDAEIRARAEPWLTQLEKLVPRHAVTGHASVTRAARRSGPAPAADDD